jgi:hypothetical protein
MRSHTNAFDAIYRPNIAALLVFALSAACSSASGGDAPPGSSNGGLPGFGGAVAAGGAAAAGGVAASTGGVGAIAAGGGGASAVATGGAPPSPTTGSSGLMVDPSITFTWPEDTGASGPPCKAGHYQGSFAGNYTSGASIIGIPLAVTGNVDFVLNQSMAGEFFDIGNGHVTGTASGGTIVGVPFSADIVGTLNCNTGQIENAGLKNGQYTALGIFVGKFEGPVTGQYDRTTSTFTSGTWNVKEIGAAGPQFGGAGTWDAKWVGP